MTSTMYNVYRYSAKCDSCSKQVSTVYGMGSNGPNEGDVIAYCEDCLRDQNPGIYLKHVKKGNIENLALKQALNYIEKAKQLILSSQLDVRIALENEN